MAVKDISDVRVCLAVVERRLRDSTACQVLQEMTGQPKKVCWRALERAERRGLIDCGSSLNVAYLTPEGFMLLLESVS
jgi:hypothetical protein